MGKSKILNDDIVFEIVRLYSSGECCSKDVIGKRFGTSKRVISRILKENNIETIRTGTRNKITPIVVGDKYIADGNFTFVAKHKVTGKEFSDYNNVSGCLIGYIKTISPDIEIPSVFLRKSYYLKTGNYWYEQYFDIIKTPLLASKRSELNDFDISEIIRLYSTGSITGIHKLAKMFNVGHKRISSILKDNNIILNKRGGLKIYPTEPVLKYVNDDLDYLYLAVHKVNGVCFKDYNNVSGILTKYAEINDNIIAPKLESEKRKYFLTTGNYWYEQYFDILKFRKLDLKLKPCPYCNIDIDCSLSDAKYKNHMYRVHNIDVEKHVSIFNSDLYIFKDDLKNIKRLNNKDNWVECKICGEKFGFINNHHLNKHNITLSEYKEKYGLNMSLNYLDGITKTMKLNNESGKMISFVSKPEKEIKDFLDGLGVDCETNRQMLIGKEIDILNHDKKIGIEFNGCKWHTEWFGKKDMNYHLAKTIACNNAGYSLIHIFEDEFQYKKDIIFHKLKHIFKKDDNLIKIGGRKCVINEIDGCKSSVFLDKFHVQGSSKSTVYLGAYYNNELVAVMTFKVLNNNSKDYDLTRFATNYNYTYQGLASKMLSYFVKNYNPSSIISFADRRWTLDKDNNLYTKLGFSLVKILRPDYRYYNEKVNKHERFHKFGFRKQILAKKYGFDLSLTETEMVKALGYDRIWDCGLFKYKLDLKENGDF